MLACMWPSCCRRCLLASDVSATILLLSSDHNLGLDASWSASVLDDGRSSSSLPCCLDFGLPVKGSGSCVRGMKGGVSSRRIAQHRASWDCAGGCLWDNAAAVCWPLLSSEPPSCGFAAPSGCAGPLTSLPSCLSYRKLAAFSCLSRSACA